MNESRNGIFTSSEIYKLMTFDRTGKNPGSPFFTYVKHKRYERRTGRRISNETSSRPTSWGQAIEGYVHLEYLLLEYKLCSKDTVVHPSLKFAGTQDVLNPMRVGDIKCPFTLEAFMDLVEVFESGSVELLKEEAPNYYWQLVSNSILTGRNTAELIVFCPKQSQLEEIRDYVDNLDEPDSLYKYKFIVDCSDDELPYLKDISEVESLQRFVFEVPEEDKSFLLKRVDEATELLTTKKR